MIEGSMERLNAILMTAFTSTGFGSPGGGGGPGKSLQPLSVVLGGLFTSTALTLLVLPHCTPSLARFWCRKKHFLASAGCGRRVD